MVVLADGPIERLLRGDWQTPDLVVVVYLEQWADSLLQLITAIGEQTEVAIVTRHGDSISQIASWLATEGKLSPRIHFLDAEVDSPWIRDYGPIEVSEHDGSLVWLDPFYYGNRPVDDTMPQLLGKRQNVRAEMLPVALDGGALIGSGDGLCVTTRKSMDDVEFGLDDHVAVQTFLRKLGCQALAVVPALAGERTGHIDIIAQFLARDLVAVARVDPRVSPDLARDLDEVASTISRAAELIDHPLSVARVYMPLGGENRFYTYVNGIALGEGFAVPSYEAVPPAEETMALSELATALANNPLIPIGADEMIELFGAVHCIVLGLSKNPLPLSVAAGEHNFASSVR